MSDDDDRREQQRRHRHHRHHEPWSKGSAQLSVSVSSVSVAAVRSATSPLAVSVSGPVFRASNALEPEHEHQQPQSRSQSLSKSPDSCSSSRAAHAPGPKREREFRGKCLYQSRKCENERALKRNGKAHNLCDEHRSKQNQHQRKFDAKKFSRKRRSGARSGDDDDDDDDEHDEENDQENQGDRERAQSRPDVKHNSEPQRDEPPSSSNAAGTSAASKPQHQRKIRRFEGTKYASQRRRQQETESAQGSHQIKVEQTGAVVSPGAAGVSRNQGPERPPSPFVPEQYGGRNQMSYHQQQPQEYLQRHSPPHGYVISHGHQQQQHQRPQAPYQYHHQHQVVRRNEDLGYYRPELESSSSATPRGVPGGFHAAGHPSPRPRSSSASTISNAPSGFVGRPLIPLRPLSTIVATPGSRIPVGAQRHPNDRVGPSPEQVHRQGQEVGPPSEDPRIRSGFAQRGAPYGGDGVQPFQHHYQAEYSHPRPQVPPPSAAAQESGYAPTKYSHSELIAASILVPGAAGAAPPVATRQQYPEAAAVAAEHGNQHQQHHHTTVSPRGALAMHHPSSYAISPHHARPQASPPSYEKQQQYYLRAQQQTQAPAGSERMEVRHLPRHYSPPSATAVTQYPVTRGPQPPSQMLPSLSSQTSSGSTPPAHSLSMPRALPSPSMSGHRHYPPQAQHQHYQQHPQSIPPSRHSPLAPTPVLPSLAPFRTRDPPSNPAKQQR